MATEFTVTLDFGASLTDYGSVAVTGQAGIVATSRAEAWFMGATTVDSDEEDHVMAAVNTRLVCGIPTAGVGMTVYAFVEQGLTKGTYKVQGVWN